jgi:RNA polymerase sigma-70 factor (ECF subfamily)
MEPCIGVKYLTSVGGEGIELEELVLASQEGDIKSFVELVRLKEEIIYRIARTYTCNSYDAEDCISEAVLKAYDRVRQLRDYSKFYVWFISILINICRKKYKAAARENEYIVEVHEASDESLINFSENSLVVENILNHLKENEREIIVLRYLKDFTLEEIAEILDIPKGTVKSRLNRTIARIRLKYRRLFSNEV